MNHGLKLHPDGTLEITMPKGKKVGRVLVCEAGTQNGSLYYPERDVLDTNDVIYRQDAIDACKHALAKGLEPSQYIEILPSAEPEIIRCKDCVKLNRKLGSLDEHYNRYNKSQCCPMIEFRGMPQGHEFDYQYCSWAERRTDEIN